MIHKHLYISNIIILFGLAFTTLVSAHFDASDPDFCKGGEKIKISEIDLSGVSLNLAIEKSDVNCPVGITDKENRLTSYIGKILVNNNIHQKHDIFDQPKSSQKAYSYASCICASLVNEEIDPDKIRPLFEGPEELLGESHHNDYDLDQGLIFSCYVCK